MRLLKNKYQRGRQEAFFLQGPNRAKPFGSVSKKKASNPTRTSFCTIVVTRLRLQMSLVVFYMIEDLQCYDKQAIIINNAESVCPFCCECSLHIGTRAS